MRGEKQAKFFAWPEDNSMSDVMMQTVGTVVLDVAQHMVLVGSGSRLWVIMSNGK